MGTDSLIETYGGLLQRIAELERELTIIKHMILANRYHYGNFPQDLVDAALLEENASTLPEPADKPWYYVE